MAWDGLKLPGVLATGATNAANAAANGAKNAAYLGYLQTQIGSGYLRQLHREGVKVWEATASGSLPISGNRFELPLTATQSSISAADIDTGEWVHYVRNASDSTKYIATAVTPSAGAGPARLSSDLTAGGSITLGSFLLNSPGFDVPVGSGPYTLADGYASGMTLLNDYPPGNLCAGSIWPATSAFPTSPYGSTINTQSYIVDPGGNRFLLWGWIMPPKGVLTTAGNWRVQMRDYQVAVKVDSLAGAWNLLFGPTQPVNYGPNSLGGARTSGNISNCANTTLITLYDPNQNPLQARLESSGGMSFKNVGTSEPLFQVEVNVPAGSPDVSGLPASATSDRCVAFAAVFWCRIVADDPSKPVPSNIPIGAMLGVDFYGSAGRLGTPGQSRLVQLDTNWKPIVMAFVKHAGGTRLMTAAETGAWLSANPPPFV